MLLILAPALILAVEDRIGTQFIPSVEYTRFAVVSTALEPVAATPPATKSPLPNAMALQRERAVSELGTSLQLIPSYENMREFVVSPPATQTPFPTPDPAVSEALEDKESSSEGAYAIVRTFVIIGVAPVMAVQRIPF
jgi:hypothetical protein